MENLVRLLMRFILVPLGYLAASIAGTLVFLVGTWPLVSTALSENPDGPALFGFVIGGSVLLLFVLPFMLLPASIGILISEAFAIRSWIFHVLNGVASAWLGCQLSGTGVGKQFPSDEPLVLVAVGIAGGFAYWAVAGFSAGFYKPIFRGNSPPAVPATTR
jgi:hypothetical protein